MKILAYCASPNKNGNSSWTMEQYLKGFNNNDVIKKYYASDLNIKCCNGCLACNESFNCVIDDDMQDIYQDLDDTDLLIIAMPVYMGEMNGHAKIFMDRLYAKITPHFSPRYHDGIKKKKLVLIFTQGNPDQNKFMDYFMYTKKMFNMLEFDVLDMIIITNTRSFKAYEQVGLEDDLVLKASNIKFE
ncbi:MAG: flavodoxin family protein [Bacilli bacterium]|jgi:multimeric flavodoxin WrbA|nr:flavodoxin family protein [Bacilli bacterium]